MGWSLVFFLNSALFGVGLAMDAFSVSLANGLKEPCMKRGKMAGIAGVYCGFQILMPLLGWICVHTIVTVFDSLLKFVPWIALLLLGYIGGKMLVEGIKQNNEENSCTALTFGALLVQGIATSIDALSVGFTIAELDFAHALTESVIIGAVTFAVCIAGLIVGKLFGTKLQSKASVLGGIILIGIGLEIFISSWF